LIFIRQRHAAERLPAAGTENQRRLLLAGALAVHQRDQLAGDERQGNEQRRKGDPGHRENDVDAVRGEPAAEQSLQPKQQDEYQPRHDRRDREWQINQGQQQVLTRELELGDGPSGRQSECGVKRHADRGCQECQPDRSERFRF
jgi:hypothetical protein